MSDNWKGKSWLFGVFKLYRIKEIEPLLLPNQLRENVIGVCALTSVACIYFLRSLQAPSISLHVNQSFRFSLVCLSVYLSICLSVCRVCLFMSTLTDSLTHPHLHIPATICLSQSPILSSYGLWCIDYLYDYECSATNFLDPHSVVPPSLDQDIFTPSQPCLSVFKCPMWYIWTSWSS